VSVYNTFRRTGAARRGHDKGITVGHWFVASGQSRAIRGCDECVHAHLQHQIRLGCMRQALINDQHCVSRVPFFAHVSKESVAGGHVESHQLTHVNSVW